MVVEIEFYQKFADLFSYIPTNLKGRKDKNWSPQVYLALSRTNGYNIKPSTKQDRDGTKALLDMVWSKIEEKFSKLQAAFRFFDRSNVGFVTYNEFAYGLERIGMKLSSEDVRKVFSHLNLNGDGKITFNKFVQLAEENRIDLNPYTPASNGDTTTSASRSQPRSESASRIISRRLSQYKSKQNQKLQIPDDFSFGR